MASTVDKLSVKVEMSESLERELRNAAHEIAQELSAEYAQAFDARIRSIVFDAMREREVRVARPMDTRHYGDFIPTMNGAGGLKTPEQ